MNHNCIKIPWIDERGQKHSACIRCQQDEIIRIHDKTKGTYDFRDLKKTKYHISEVLPNDCPEEWKDETIKLLLYKLATILIEDNKITYKIRYEKDHYGSQRVTLTTEV